MHPVLHDIVARKSREVAEARERVPVEELRERISELGRPRNFFGALVDRRHRDAIRVVAELKRATSAGEVIRAELDPIAMAQACAAGGAAAISVVIDGAGPGGRLEHLHMIRDAVKLPVLRKDLIVDAYQVWESRAAGADAILLVAEALPERDVIDFQILATELGMTTLLEVHDVEHLLRAVHVVGFPHASYSLLAISNRHLRTMRPSVEHAMRLAELLEDTSVVVADGGIRSADDLRRLRDHGIHAAIVGEHLMRADDPAAALRALLA